MTERTGPSTADRVRVRAATVVGLVCVVIAVVIVLAAVTVAARGSINADNVLVELVRGVANVFDGPFSRTDGIFSFDGENRVTWNALVNWGIAALAWLAIGRVGSGLLRP